MVGSRSSWAPGEVTLGPPPCHPWWDRFFLLLLVGLRMCVPCALVDQHSTLSSYLLVGQDVYVSMIRKRPSPSSLPGAESTAEYPAGWVRCGCGQGASPPRPARRLLFDVHPICPFRLVSFCFCHFSISTHLSVFVNVLRSLPSTSGLVLQARPSHTATPGWSAPSTCAHSAPRSTLSSLVI